MLHPSYSDLMNVVNKEVEEGETPVVNSRYSIVMATSKRARQIVSGAEPQVNPNGKKHFQLRSKSLLMKRFTFLENAKKKQQWKLLIKQKLQ